MASKKSLLLITAIILTAGFATANSFEESPESKIWLNSDEPEANFQVKYDKDCVDGSNNPEDTRKVKVNPGKDGEETLTVKEDGDQTKDDEGNDVENTYDFSYELEETGSYELKASCKGENDDTNTMHSNTVGFKANNLELSGLDWTVDEENVDTAYVGDTVEGSIELTSEGVIGVGEFSVEDLNFNVEDVSVEQPSEDNGVKTFDFSFEASGDLKEVEELTVNVSGFNVEESTDFNVEDVWQVDNLQISTDEVVPDQTVKYRKLGDLSMSFNILRRGEAYTDGISTSSFKLDQSGLSTEDGWFTKSENGGDFSLELDRTPSFDLEPAQNTEVDVSIENEEIGELEVSTFDVERDVEFSGTVQNVRNNGVSTDFRVENNDWVREFSTGENGEFSRFIEASEVDEMRMEFPEATLALSGMEVDNEDAEGLSYEYYDNVEENVELEDDLGLRPVNLGVFISNYFFDKDEEGRDTWARMEFDTSDVKPEDIEVYECNTWTFSGEFCSDDWSKIDENDVDLTPGATWKAEFPVDPRESDRFGHERGILTNAYLVGVPRGVGSGLTLEDSIDVSSDRVRSGEEFSVSGRVISDSTGDGVGGADVELVLESDGNTVSVEGETSSDGRFDLSTTVDEAGSYSVSFEAYEPPYESFEDESGSTIDVYYETGLSVESESDPTVELGEDYSIEYTVENTGQASAEDLEFSVSGINDYSLSPNSVDSLDAGDSQAVDLSLSIDEDLTRPPTITFEVSASSSAEDVRGSATTTVNLDRETTDSENSTDETDETGTESSSSLPDTEEITRATGDFIQSQSDMNLALGLILVFGVILAVAVRKRKNEAGDDRINGRMGSRPVSGGNSRVQKPDVSPKKVDGSEDGSVEEESSEVEEKEGVGNEKEQDQEENEEGEFVCDTCGESFDTESGLNLHEQALH